MSITRADLEPHADDDGALAKYRANLARRADAADELFKSRLKLAVIVVIIIVILLASGSLNSWLDNPAPCLDCVRGS